MCLFTYLLSKGTVNSCLSLSLPLNALPYRLGVQDGGTGLSMWLRAWRQRWVWQLDKVEWKKGEFLSQMRWRGLWGARSTLGVLFCPKDYFYLIRLCGKGVCKYPHGMSSQAGAAWVASRSVGAGADSWCLAVLSRQQSLHFCTWMCCIL